MLVAMKTRNLREMEKHWAKEAERKAKLAKSKAAAAAPAAQTETAAPATTAGKKKTKPAK
jgi:hypothetical protein